MDAAIIFKHTNMCQFWLQRPTILVICLFLKVMNMDPKHFKHYLSLQHCLMELTDHAQCHIFAYIIEFLEDPSNENTFLTGPSRFSILCLSMSRRKITSKNNLALTKIDGQQKSWVSMTKIDNFEKLDMYILSDRCLFDRKDITKKDIYLPIRH